MNTVIFCLPVKDTEVLEKVTSLVRASKHEIVVTHSDQDQSKVIPDKKYFKTLAQKIQNGISVTRYVYSSQTPSEFDSYNVKQVLAGPNDSYQRAVVVDQSIAMFKLGDTYYYSEYRPLVKALLCYIQQKEIN